MRSAKLYWIDNFHLYVCNKWDDIKITITMHFEGEIHKSWMQITQVTNMTRRLCFPMYWMTQVAFWSKANYGVWGLEGPAQTDQDDAEPRDRMWKCKQNSTRLLPPIIVLLFIKNIDTDILTSCLFIPNLRSAKYNYRRPLSEPLFYFIPQ